MNTTSKWILKVLRDHESMSINQIANLAGLRTTAITSRLYYWVSIGKVEKTGVKPYYLYKLK